MKNSSKLLIIIFLFHLGSCTKKTEEEQMETSSKTAKVVADEAVDDDVNEPLTIYHNQIREAFFFSFRQLIDGIDTYRLIKYENIEMNGQNVIYTMVTVPEEEMAKFTNREVVEASFLSIFTNNESGIDTNDTISFTGVIAIQELVSANPEQKPQTISIEFLGTMERSYITYRPYREPQREFFNDDVEVFASVDLNNPKIYSREEMYLKARIHELEKDDLAGYSKKDLAILRNEIFARHGHSFKTETMQNHFNGLSWYIPFVDDATDHLNATEKNNVQFIKSLEEQV